MFRNVALVISSEELQNWSGGLSYYINLLNILKKLQKTNLHIYTDSSSFIKNLNINKSCFVKELRCLRKGNIFFYLRKLIILLFKKDYILYCILLSDKINILSHRRLFKNKNIKSIGWIPDLQQKFLKKFFQHDTLVAREKYVAKEIKNSDYIFVSSFQVKKEFKKFYNLNNTIIPLRISSSFISNSKKTNSNNSLKKFILFPSQFWKHKNHDYLIQVAKKIKKYNIKIKIFFCGKIFDNRNIDYYEKLNKKIKKNKLNNVITNYGEVSRKKLDFLQRSCLAFVNPSYYEGWSTINEESRARNKYIFLSNIQGHKEQNNPGGIYFNNSDPMDFIRKLKQFLKKKKFLKRKKLIKKNNFFISKLNIEALNVLDKIYK